MTICEDNGAERQEERKMKVKQLTPTLFYKSNIRIHDADAKIVYVGEEKDIPEEILEREIRLISADLNMDTTNYHYIPTIVIGLEVLHD